MWFTKAAFASFDPRIETKGKNLGKYLQRIKTLVEIEMCHENKVVT